jgi:hypothetical protein
MEKKIDRTKPLYPPSPRYETSAIAKSEVTLLLASNKPTPQD